MQRLPDQGRPRRGIGVLFGKITDMQTPSARHWFLLAYLVIAWGFAFYLIAVALTGFEPVTIVWGRLTFGAGVMLSVLALRRTKLPSSWLWWRRLLFLSITGNVLPFTLIAWAEQSVPSGEVGLLMALMPITILLMGHYFLDHEPLTLLRIIGVVAGFAGVSVLLGDQLTAGLPAGEERLRGQLAAVFATLCYAVNGIYTKRLPTFDTVSVSAGSLLIGSIVLMGPAILVQDWHAALLQPKAWLAVGTLGFFATGVATWVYFTVVSEVGPGFLSTINYLIPALAFIVGLLALNEPAGWPQWSALALIIAGVWLIQPRAPIAQNIA